MMKCARCPYQCCKMRDFFSCGLPVVQWKSVENVFACGAIRVSTKSYGSRPIRSAFSWPFVLSLSTPYPYRQQLQRVIRTGRTGHWLNHTKEHMLVGLKTNVDSNGNLKFPSWVNRGLDTDTIVSEVRETSRKPDEAYGLIERMCPGGRKIEIFGRKHNTRPGCVRSHQLGRQC